MPASRLVRPVLWLVVLLTAVRPVGAATDVATLLREAGIRPVVPRTAAPDFTLPRLGGEAGSLSDHGGSWVLLTFWATWCGPCRSELPTLEALHRSHSASGLVVVGVSLDRDMAPVGPFLTQLDLTFPNYWDGSGSTGSTYLASSIPTTYLIDPGGQVAGFARGARDWQALAPVLEAVLAAEPAAEASSASFAAPGTRVRLATVTDPPDAQLELQPEPVHPGEPFEVTVRVFWSGTLDQYLLHPPELFLPQGIERLGVAAESSSRDGRSVVTYRVSLRASEPGRFALDPVEIRYTPLLEPSPVATRLAGPTVEVAPRTWLGMAPRAAALGVGGLVLLGAVGGLVWHRRGRGSVAERSAARFDPGRLKARLEAARGERLSGDLRRFVLELVAIESELGEPGVEVERWVDGVRYGDQLPSPVEIEQLERRVERRLQSLSSLPDSEERKALKLREDES